MLGVVAPFDQRYVVPEEDVNVTLPPAQKVKGPPAVIVGAAGGVGTAATGTVPDDGEVHPPIFVTVKVYVFPGVRPGTL
jgi:hypothetical protein